MMTFLLYLVSNKKYGLLAIHHVALDHEFMTHLFLLRTPTILMDANILGIVASLTQFTAILY